MAEIDLNTESNSAVPVTVVVTHLDKPDLPFNTSSEVCRSPVGLPPLDIERLMKETKLQDDEGKYYYPFHFPFDKKNLDREGKRLFAILKFKLAMKVSNNGLPCLHIVNI